MAYEAKTWECGEYITNDDLNHMEDGIAQASAQADDVSTRMATAENDIDVLDARMDTFASLPEGSTTADAELIDIRVGADGTVYPTAGDAVRGQVSDLKSDINEISEEVTSTNVYDESAGIAQRYVNEANGNFEIGGSYTAWDYMDISQWDTIVISRYGTLGITLRYALFDENKTYISGALYTGTGTVDEDTRMTYLEIPRNGAKYIRVSYLTEFISPNVMFSVGGANLYQPCITDVIPKGTKNTKTLENFVMGQEMPIAKADTMANGAYLTLPRNNIQSGDEIIFYAKVSNFSRIDIGHIDYAPNEIGLRFLISETAIQWVVNGAVSSPVYHGLTIKDYIRISIKVYRNGNYDIRIDTNGGTYTRNGNTYYNGYYGFPVVYVYGTTQCSECALMQVIPTLLSKVWVFGDSYLSYHTERWSYYMYEDGIRDVLLNGFPGQTSASAYDSFKELIKYGKPQYAIWALGMNDGDSTELNASWQVRTQYFINDCISNSITPVLCTIPNTPIIKNTLKNNFVRASGLQYIDFAKAVNADTEGSTWYDGMLSADDTHPTADGAKALYSRFIVDFPQIFNRNNNTLI